MTACAEWTGGRAASGYGYTYIRGSGYGAGDGRFMLAHRAAWEQVNGPIPDGLQVHHVCENRLCVEPAHMKLIDVRHHAGAGGHGKLTQETADEIRRLRALGERGIDIAARFGISKQQVCNIWKGRCWA